MPATILVADDNSNIQRMVTHELRGEGFNVIAVGNGEAAVRKISELHPDLVLADVFMPVRTGYEVCEFVKKNEALAGIPVVLLIGAFDPLDEAEVQRVRADGVLKKPFVPPDPLVLTVKQLLARSRAGTAQAGVPARSPTAAAPTFDFVGNDHTPTPVQAFLPPTPPVPRPYPAEPPPLPSSLTHAKPTEAAARVEKKAEEEEPTPQDWITRPEPITYLGREEDKPLIFSDLLEETLPPETGRPLAPEEEARELLKEKTSAFYDFDALETGDSQNAVAEPRPGGASSAPAETESPSLRGADQVIPAEAPWWESSGGETPALNPPVRDGTAVEESEPKRVLEDVSTTRTPPATNLQGWLQETFLLGAGMPRRPATAGLPADSGSQAEASVFDSPAWQTPAEAPFGPPPTETEPVPGAPTPGEPFAQPLELSELAREEGSKLPELPEEVTLDSQPLVSQLVGTEETSFGPLSGVSHEPVADSSEAQEASEPIEEIPMERQWVVEEAFAPPDRIGAPSGSEPESRREELPAPFAQNLVEQAFEVDAPPQLTAEETTAPERFWSEPEPPQVEETTEPIRTEPFATEPFLTEPPSTATTPAGESAASPDLIGASEESSVAEEPFLTVPVSDELVEAEQPSAYAPAGIGAAFPESEPIGTHHAGEPFLSPAIEPEEPRPVEGVEPEFQLTPPAAPPPENGELVQKVVEEVMSRLSPDLLEQISRELVKPLAEAVLKQKNRPKPE